MLSTDRLDAIVDTVMPITEIGMLVHLLGQPAAVRGRTYALSEA